MLIINNQIKVNYFFKGCKSLLFPPDISNWNAKFIEDFNISSFNSNSISIKEVKNDSIISQDISENYDIIEDSFSSNDNNDTKSFKSSDYIDKPENDELNDYYDNFYN